jgi:hypothetical protein
LQIKEAYQCCSEENAENKQALLVAHRKDEKSTQMLNELTAVCIINNKEYKNY